MGASVLIFFAGESIVVLLESDESGEGRLPLCFWQTKITVRGGSAISKQKRCLQTDYQTFAFYRFGKRIKKGASKKADPVRGR